MARHFGILQLPRYRGTHNHYGGLRSDTHIRCLWSLQGPLIININFTQCYARYYQYFTCRCCPFPLGLRKMAAPCQSPEGARSDPAKWLWFDHATDQVCRNTNVMRVIQSIGRLLISDEPSACFISFMTSSTLVATFSFNPSTDTVPCCGTSNRHCQQTALILFLIFTFTRGREPT